MGIPGGNGYVDDLVVYPRGSSELVFRQPTNGKLPCRWAKKQGELLIYRREPEMLPFVSSFSFS